MHIDLHSLYSESDAGKSASELTSACVHCGFCLETCPTYLDNRDERDSPRGRIYLIKQMLETGAATQETRRHLDRCLTCRSCETTCPSGMQYGKLLDIGRGEIEVLAPRPWWDKLTRWGLRKVLVLPHLVRFGLTCAQIIAPLLPGILKRRIPAKQSVGKKTTTSHPRKMLILEGCVQRAVTPKTNAATRRVLDRSGVSLIAAKEASCCGALSYHLGAHEEGLQAMRRNIDAWWPHIEAGAEAIISSASGCGVMIADYAHLLEGDAQYADKAARVSALHRDLSEVVSAEMATESNPSTLTGARKGKIAIHTPCTLQHGQGLPHTVQTLLTAQGFEIAATDNSHLCCGSAGTYSILQPAISSRLGQRAAEALSKNEPELIVTANIGCQLQLQAASDVPVIHWIELLDTATLGDS